MTGLQMWWLDAQDVLYRCFIEDNRWRYLAKGLGNTLHHLPNLFMQM